MDASYSRVNYALGNTGIFDFTLNLDSFFLTSNGPIITAKNYLTRTYIGYFQSGGWMFTSTYTGQSFIQVTGPCNMSDPAFGYDGVECRDNNKFLAFN